MKHLVFWRKNVFIEKWNNLPVNKYTIIIKNKKDTKNGKKMSSWFSELKTLNTVGFMLSISRENGLQKIKMFHEDSFIYLRIRATSPDLIRLKIIHKLNVRFFNTMSSHLVQTRHKEVWC